MSDDQNSLASRRKEGGYPLRYLTDAQRRGRATLGSMIESLQGFRAKNVKTPSVAKGSLHMPVLKCPYREERDSPHPLLITPYFTPATSFVLRKIKNRVYLKLDGSRGGLTCEPR